MAYPTRGHFPLPVVDPALRLEQAARSRRMPRESLDAPENLPKERRRQEALGQLEDEVAGMSDEAPAGLLTAVAGGSAGSDDKRGVQ